MKQVPDEKELLELLEMGKRFAEKAKKLSEMGEAFAQKWEQRLESKETVK